MKSNDRESMGLLVIQSRCRAGRYVPHAARTGVVPKGGLAVGPAPVDPKRISPDFVDPAVALARSAGRAATVVAAGAFEVTGDVA